MKFSQFLSEVDALIKEVEQLIENADTVAWDPSVGKEFAGTGVNKDVGSTRRIPQRSTAPVGRAKAGDVVVIKDPSGRLTPGIIANIEQDNAVIVNPQRNIKVTRPVGGMSPAPQSIAQQLQSKYPNKTVWMYDPKMDVPL